ncbi:MAG TPA: ThuA domain-containing protein [Phycisphaerae bacterium]|nr:ThuA domain-containing protein [Phycisphaerae bacterium]
MASALIVHGGWKGHQPAEVAGIFAEMLRGDGFSVKLADTLDAFATEPLAELDLIVPLWTMGKIAPEQANPLLAAVRDGGVGLAGCHGGMCDAFRENTDYQFMTGGQWVAHPGNDTVTYPVQISDRTHEITAGIDDFSITSEQYYLHVDPAVRVLATTPFPIAPGPHTPNGPVNMPQVWTKFYGKGRVFYNALGHQAAIFTHPAAAELMRRGFRWAARKNPERSQGLNLDAGGHHA